MTEDDVYDLLQAYLVKIDQEAFLLNSAWPQLTNVIRSHQDGPRPEGPYGMIQILSVRDLGAAQCLKHEEETIDNESRIIETRGRAVGWLIRIHIFAHYQTEHLRLFRNALDSEHSNIELYPLIIREVKEITPAPELIQGAFEGRGHMDTVMIGCMETRHLIDVIERGKIIIAGNGGAVVHTTLDYEKP